MLLTVQGSKGSVIHINPEDLETLDGQPLGSDIKVELKELISNKDFVKNNVQTISDGKLLVSGGAYFINMSSDGRLLRLKEGKKLKIELPVLTDKKMILFYGQKDSLGGINWKPTEQKFGLAGAPAVIENQKRIIVENKPDSSQMDKIFDYLQSMDTTSPSMTIQQKEMAKENYRLDKKLYNAIEIDKFGWINCDRFLDNPNNTDLKIELDPKDSVECANVYFVFRDIKSVLQEYCGTNNARFTNMIENVPVGKNVRIIAYSIKGGKVLSFSNNYTIRQNDVLKFSLTETPESEFQKLMGN